MPFVSLNPTTEELIKQFSSIGSEEIHAQLSITHQVQQRWKTTSFSHRSHCFRQLNDVLMRERDELALIMTTEMGKPIKESRSEVENALNFASTTQSRVKNSCKQRL